MDKFDHLVEWVCVCCGEDGRMMMMRESLINDGGEEEKEKDNVGLI